MLKILHVLYELGIVNEWKKLQKKREIKIKFFQLKTIRKKIRPYHPIFRLENSVLSIQLWWYVDSGGKQKYSRVEKEEHNTYIAGEKSSLGGTSLSNGTVCTSLFLYCLKLKWYTMAWLTYFFVLKYRMLHFFFFTILVLSTYSTGKTNFSYSKLIFLRKYYFSGTYILVITVW